MHRKIEILLRKICLLTLGEVSGVCTSLSSGGDSFCIGKLWTKFAFPVVTSCGNTGGSEEFVR